MERVERLSRMAEFKWQYCDYGCVDCKLAGGRFISEGGDPPPDTRHSPWTLPTDDKQDQVNADLERRTSTRVHRVQPRRPVYVESSMSSIEAGSRRTTRKLGTSPLKTSRKCKAKVDTVDYEDPDEKREALKPQSQSIIQQVVS